MRGVMILLQATVAIVLLAVGVKAQTSLLTKSFDDDRAASPGLAALYVDILESHDADLKYALAVVFEDGVHVSPHPEQALHLYRLAADQGSVRAQDTLGDAYRDGSLGLLRDVAEAAKWYRKAADQGSPSAQYELARCYFVGTGVPQDYVQAHMWANVAVTQFSSNKSVAAQAGVSPFLQRSASENLAAATELRDQITARMTPQQLAEAQRLAKEWKPTKPK